MAYSSYSQQPRTGFDNFGPWLTEVFQLFIARWWVYALQGLIASLTIAVPILLVGAIFGAAIFLPLLQGGRGDNMERLMMDNAGGFIVLILMLGVVAWIVSAIIYPGMVVTALKQIRGQEINVSDLFTGTKFGWGYFVINLVISLGVLGCGIGMLFTGAFFCLALPILIDRNKPAGDALSESYETTKKDMFFFMIFFVVLILMIVIAQMILNIVMLGFLVGLISYPIISLAMVVAYERTFNGYGGSSIPMMQQGVPIPPPYMATPGGPTSVPQPPEAPQPPVWPPINPTTPGDTGVPTPPPPPEAPQPPVWPPINPPTRPTDSV